MRLTKVVNHQTSCPPVSKKRGAIPGDNRQQINLAGLGIAADAQAIGMGKIWHSIALLCF